MADLLKPWWKKNNDRGRLTILPESQTSLEEGGVTSRSCSNVNLKRGAGVEVEFRLDLDIIYFIPKKTSTGHCLITMCKVQVVLTSKSLIYAKPSAWDCTEFIFLVTQCKGSTSFPTELRKWISWQKVVEVDRKMCWSADWLRSSRRRRKVEKSGGAVVVWWA